MLKCAAFLVFNWITYRWMNVIQHCQIVWSLIKRNPSTESNRYILKDFLSQVLLADSSSLGEPKNLLQRSLQMAPTLPHCWCIIAWEIFLISYSYPRGQANRGVLKSQAPPFHQQFQTSCRSLMLLVVVIQLQKYLVLESHQSLNGLKVLS